VDEPAHDAALKPLARVLGGFRGGLEQAHLARIVALSRSLRCPRPAAADVVDRARGLALVRLELLALDLVAQRVQALVVALLQGLDQALARLLLVSALVLAPGAGASAPFGGELSL
jgi:hypothetical protein